MSTNLNDSTPAAPANSQNVKWQTDGSGNASAYVPNGPALLPGADLLTQAANISATDLVASGDVTGGMYEISIYIIVTQAASSTSTMPSVSITWTDADNITGQTITATATSSGNLLTTYAQARVTVDARNGFAIQYATASYASSGGTPMQYALHIRVSKLG